ncbi:MAG TPA: transcription termination/antitermination protein NusA [Acholeplasmataceae bacterium]|nr:transcription termination/antitermination protein NusA [Acholeplasmataceae bacterium]
MISKNFFESLEAIAYERGLDIDDILARVEVAMQIACKNSDVPYKGTIKLEADYDKKRIDFYNYQYVVDEIDPNGPRGQILLEDALQLRQRVKVGSEIKDKVDLKLFKRKAASMFKQNFLNELKTLEREEAYKYFVEKEGEVVTGKVIGVHPKFVTLSIGKNVEATMSSNEIFSDEEYNIGDEKKVYITKVEKTGKGPKVFISRTNREIVRKLFEMNIPEVADGSIEIVAIARDPGSRSKVGVMAIDPNIDPKGACVGNAGIRIKAINAALNDEKIDIFVWKDNPVDLIAEALSPARVLSVIPELKEKKATVIVSDDQFSLAIGSKGQNARLAVLATGWKIDIKKLSDAEEEGIEFTYNVNN